MNLRSLLAELAKKYAQKTAVASGKTRLSYAELNEASNKVADTLVEMGIEKGDRVVLLLSNSPEFVSFVG